MEAPWLGLFLGAIFSFALEAAVFLVLARPVKVKVRDQGTPPRRLKEGRG